MKLILFISIAVLVLVASDASRLQNYYEQAIKLLEQAQLQEAGQQSKSHSVMWQN